MKIIKADNLFWGIHNASRTCAHTSHTCETWPILPVSRELWFPLLTHDATTIRKTKKENVTGQRLSFVIEKPGPGGNEEQRISSKDRVTHIVRGRRVTPVRSTDVLFELAGTGSMVIKLAERGVSKGGGYSPAILSSSVWKKHGKKCVADAYPRR